MASHPNARRFSWSPPRTPHVSPLVCDQLPVWWPRVRQFAASQGCRSEKELETVRFSDTLSLSMSRRKLVDIEPRTWCEKPEFCFVTRTHCSFGTIANYFTRWLTSQVRALKYRTVANFTTIYGTLILVSALLTLIYWTLSSPRSVKSLILCYNPLRTGNHPNFVLTH